MKKKTADSVDKKENKQSVTSEKKIVLKNGKKVVTPVQFAKDTRLELQKVTWPTRQVVIKATLIILFIVAFSTVLVGGVDILFAKLIFLLKARF
ncbi:preprotein translocase subunit SecE [bacterium]|jgi:preprotein translocase subunit SecE|nr:preprotein translocase subunit SecE [bacterium]